MYKLYLNNGTRTQIDKSDEKQDIIDTMGYFIEDNPETRFLIKHESEEFGDSVTRINGINDYLNYSQTQKVKRLIK